MRFKNVTWGTIRFASMASVQPSAQTGSLEAEKNSRVALHVMSNGRPEIGHFFSDCSFRFVVVIEIVQKFLVRHF